jgi:hypothetical protein
MHIENKWEWNQAFHRSTHSGRRPAQAERPSTTTENEIAKRGNHISLPHLDSTDASHRHIHEEDAWTVVWRRGTVFMSMKYMDITSTDETNLNPWKKLEQQAMYGPP